jgi:hypothetical protein
MNLKDESFIQKKLPRVLGARKTLAENVEQTEIERFGTAPLTN